MIQDIDLEAGTQYAIDFIGETGLPGIAEERLAEVDIHDYRGLLPCNIIKIKQVRDELTGNCMRAMTDNFNTVSPSINSERTFKAKGRYIFTSFKEGKVTISYETTKRDADGLPMVPDIPVFLNALENYIKVRKFIVLFDCGKIRGDVLQHAESECARLTRKCIATFINPSESEMEAISGMMHRLIPSRNEFRKGFKALGDKEYYKNH